MILQSRFLSEGRRGSTMLLAAVIFAAGLLIGATLAPVASAAAARSRSNLS
jgi:hypothetical protein